MREMTEAEQAILSRICKGDKSALPEFRKMLKDDPYLIEVGNLATRAEEVLLDVIATKDDLARREITLAKLAALRKELGPAGSPIESMLIERVVACWAQVYLADCQYYKKMADGMTFEAGEYWQRQQDRAHRRFLSAVKMLATVRRLARPIQVHLSANAAPAVNGEPMPPRIADRINGHAAPKNAALENRVAESTGESCKVSGPQLTQRSESR